MEDVAITGMGIVSPLGHNLSEFERRMFAGESATVDIRGSVVPENFPVPVGSVVERKGLGQPAAMASVKPEDTPMSWRFAGLATEEALSGLPRGLLVDSIVFGSESRATTEQMRTVGPAFVPECYDWDAGFAESNLHAVQQVVAAHGNGLVPDHNLYTISNACVSSNQAIGIAFQRIQRKTWKRAIVGGVNTSVDEGALMNFYSLSALTLVRGFAMSEASRPFSKDRSGFVMGEGAATLLLESRSDAEARNAPILGWVRGYGATADAYRMTDGRPDGSSSAHAMQMACDSGRRRLDEINAISAHGTSTPLNDRLETLAIKRVFGDAAYKIPVTGLKSQIGHSISASAAQQAVATILMLRRQMLAPTINYGQADPQCDLDYVPNESRATTGLNMMLSNSFGFGGQNTCIMFERSNP